MALFYQQKDQKILMFPESAYLTPLNGTKVTANPATYPWYSRINILPDGLDWDIPIQKKEKIFGVGCGKYPDHIVTTEMEPIELTLDMMYQDARFLALATGTCATTADGTQQVATITCIGTGTEGALANQDYFLIYTLDVNDNVICNEIYFDVNVSDPGSNSITGATAIEVEIATNATATAVATALAGALDGNANYSATSDGAVVTISIQGSAAHDGALPATRDGATASATAFTFATTTHGSSTHTITEGLTNVLKSFGLHIEQTNSGQDIVADLFGCVVTGHELTINYDDKIIKESVTISCPYYIVGNVCMIPPPRREDSSPAIFKALSEAVDNYIIQYYDLSVGTYTDLTPAILNSLTLSISNEVDLLPEIGSLYRQHVVAGKREITMQLVGFTQIKDLFDYWKSTWDDEAQCYSSGTDQRLNSVITIEKTATYDTLTLKIYNWLIESHNLKLFTIDDKIMGIDVKFDIATPNSSGYQIYSFVVTDFTPKIMYAEANS